MTPSVVGNLPEDAQSLVAGLTVAYARPDSAVVRIEPAGSDAFDTVLRGTARVDWGWVVIVSGDGADTTVTAVDPHTGTPSTLGRIRADETVVATVDPSGRVGYAYGPSLGLIRLVAGSTTAVGPAGSDSFPVGEPVGIGRVAWAPSGRVLGASTCSESTCSVVVLDTSTDEIRLVDRFVMLGLDDDTLIGYPAADDRTPTRLDFATGARASLVTSVARMVDGYLTPGGTAVISGRNAAGDPLVVAVRPPGGGPPVSIDIEPGAVLLPLWWSDRWAVVTTPNARSPLEAAEQGGATWALLDLMTGEMLPGTVPVGFSGVRP